MRTNNPYADFESHEAEKEKWLDSLPVCDYCGEPIQDDYYYKLDNETLCEECLNDHFRYSNDL